MSRLSLSDLRSDKESNVDDSTRATSLSETHDAASVRSETSLLKNRKRRRYPLWGRRRWRT